MSSYIIYVDHELKEAFSYKRPLNEDSVHALSEYAKATYGEDATLRHMTPDEETEFQKNGDDLKSHLNWVRTKSP